MPLRTVCTVSCLASLSACAELPNPAEVVRIKSPAVTEASGMAVSPRDGNLLWLINDSGSSAHLHLAGSDGSDRGRVVVRGARNVDWEDLSSFTLDGRGYLLIADTGDNASSRPTSTLYIVEEPAFPEPGKKGAGVARIAWKIGFKFEDGPRDCESVSVDAKAGKILLLSKRTQPPMLYELPLQPGNASQPLIAKKIGSTEVRQPAGTLPHPFGSQPTAMNLRADGSAAAVLTYVTTFVFPRKPGESWSEAFAKPPLVLQPHGLAQAEALGWSQDGAAIFLTSEGRNPPLLRENPKP